MPRINVTDEEFRVLEKLRAKNATNLGYNEALSTVIEVFRVWEPEDIGDYVGPTKNWRNALIDYITSLKRPLA